MKQTYTKEDVAKIGEYRALRTKHRLELLGRE